MRTKNDTGKYLNENDNHESITETFFGRNTNTCIRQLRRHFFVVVVSLLSSTFEAVQSINCLLISLTLFECWIVFFSLFVHRIWTMTFERAFVCACVCDECKTIHKLEHGLTFNNIEIMVSDNRKKLCL